MHLGTPLFGGNIVHVFDWESTLDGVLISIFVVLVLDILGHDL